MYNELIPDSITMIKTFKADIPFIKKRIESLIERDYLRREATDKNKLVYVPWDNELIRIKGFINHKS